MAVGFGQPAPKHEPRKRVKARAKRQAHKVVTSVRDQCVERDGYCRLAGLTPYACWGPSQWAHLGNARRFKTRGLPPEERHTTAGSLMACQGHHEAYDGHCFEIEPMTDRGSDGALRVVTPYTAVHVEFRP